MRYGKDKDVCLEIDPSARRQPGQTLKKAAPGAPYGWTRDDRPYIGTQYAISVCGTQFASVSTRDATEAERGNPAYEGTRYWKPLKSVSAKVARSAIETHGSVESLLGMCKLSASERLSVREVFTSVVGERHLAQLEALSAESAPVPSLEAQPESQSESTAKSKTEINTETGAKMPAEIDPSKLKVAALREALEERGLSKKGNKKALASRLQASLGEMNAERKAEMETEMETEMEKEIEEEMPSKMLAALEEECTRSTGVVGSKRVAAFAAGAAEETQPVSKLARMQFINQMAEGEHATLID